MTTALIGHTGFVGGVLKSQAPFDEFYSSRDIDGIVGRRFDLVVCAGAYAAKWKANQDPAADLSSIERLVSRLETVEARRFVLISTVDVYERPIAVDEAAPADATQPYGRHRRLLEEAVSARFDAQVMRLPALFGPGLKKNALFDLLHDNQVDRIHPDGVFQYYSLQRLWGDIQKARDLGIRLLNVATAPVATRDVVARFFPHTLTPSNAPAPRYDFHSRHAEAWGGDRYLYGEDSVMEDLGRFIAQERA